MRDLQSDGADLSRRQLLKAMGGGFGMVGLGSILGANLQGATGQSGKGILSPKEPHFPARAKNVIYLFLNGGVSQVDTFDHKPLLAKYHGQPMPGGAPKTERSTGALMRSPFEFKKYGQSGMEVSEIFSQVGRHVDDICFVRSCHTNVPSHVPALFMSNSGHMLPGRPSMGSWITYGLGTENQSLPGFVVLCPGMPMAGALQWNSAFLPAAFQGMHVVNKEIDPEKLIPYLGNRQIDGQTQGRQLDLLGRLNRLYFERRSATDEQLNSVIQSMEVAYRMQTEAREVFDIRNENQGTLDRYGDSEFGRGCLMALRLVEKGVRVVQVYFGAGQPWDSHADIEEHRKLGAQADPAIASLLEDLKARGLFDETLVVCGTEFGRTPVLDTGRDSRRLQNGRDHDSYGFTTWLAGAGVKGGTVYGTTDEFGFKAVENPVHVHDLHATILWLLGIDHTKLTYRFSGRDFRLTDVSGRVVKDILV